MDGSPRGEGEEKRGARLIAELRGLRERVAELEREVTTLLFTRATSSPQPTGGELEAFDQQIQRAQKLESIGLLAARIGHRFNDQLVGILGSASILRDDLPDQSPMRPRVEEIEQAGLRAARLVQQLIAYSCEARLVTEPLRLSSLLQEMDPLLRTMLSKGVTLHPHLTEDLPLVDADPTLLRQAIIALVINADEARHQRRGTISLRTGAIEVDRDVAATLEGSDLADGTFPFVEVADDGCGMDAWTRCRACEPFFTTKPARRGLGLTVALGIVRRHRGAIRIGSTPDEGTTVTMILPATDRRVQADSPARIAPSPQQTLTVLVVDDEEFVARTVGLILEARGIKVLVAHNGAEAVALFRRHLSAVDVVLLDDAMPGMSGAETMDQLRQLDPGVRVLLCSGYLERVDPRAAGFLQKPYDPVALIETIRRVAAG